MSEARKSSPLVRGLFGGAWVAAAVLVIAVAAVSWLLFTASGARFALERSFALVGGSVASVEGRLAGPLAIGSIEIATPKLRVRAQRVALDWSPTRLAGSELHVLRFQAASIDIETAASAEPARAPATLRLPLPLRLVVARAGVDRLRLGTLGEEGGGTELREITFGLVADQTAWIVSEARAGTPVGTARLSGTLGAAAPFPLDVKGELDGTRNDARYRVTIAARGPLAGIDASFAAAEGGLAGTGSARLEPFSDVPLRKLEAKFDGVDLSAFLAAPKTHLAVEADLAPGAGVLLAGSVKVANASPGPWDKGLLPVVSAAGHLAFGRDRVEATRLSLVVAGGARAEGAAAWSGGKLEARLAVKDADLLAWHTALRATKLSGTIAATVTGEVQRFTVDLADPRFGIAGVARIAGGKLTVEQARLARGPAIAQVGGTLALSGAREFAVEGRIERLDPAAFAKVPAGEINATFSARGRLAKNAVDDVRLEIAKSRFAGLAAQGRATFAVEDERLTRTDADLSLGDTRLVAKGSLGRADDAMQLRLASPDLAPIGRAFGVAIAGRVDLDALVQGTFAAPSGRVVLDARDLLLPGRYRVASLAGSVDLGSGEAGAANGKLELLGLANAGEKEPLSERALLTIKGTRQSHDIRFEAGLPEMTTLRALLAGGLVPGARSPQWRGRLESVDIGGVTPLALAAPAPLEISAERIELRDAVLAGEAGEARLVLTRWSPAGIEARGTSRGVVVRSLMRVLDLQGQLGSSLVLAGEWDVRVGETIEGFAALRRERGDVRVGEPRQALGLETFMLRADAGGGRVKASLDMRGRQMGQWQAEVTATLRRGTEGWAVSPAAPLEGSFAMDVPDLAWMAAWLGPEARAGGRLKGSGTLAGTARDPQWSGRLEATGLAIRDPTLGAEVADGTIVLALKDREARIERFLLTMPWRPGDEAARALSAVKRPPTGQVTAEGALDLGTRKGNVRLQATAFPITRLDTRFLAISGEGRADFDGATTQLSGDFTADAGWFGIPASAPPSLSDDVIVERGKPVAESARSNRVRLDVRVSLGEHLHFRGRGLTTRLAGGLRLAGEAGANLRATGTIRAVGGTYDAYNRTLTLERGALNFLGPLDNPGLNVLALRKGLPVEAGVEVTGTVNRPKVRLVSSPEVPESEKLAWLVLGRGRGEVGAGDAATLVAAANALLGRETLPTSKLLGGLGIDDLRIGRDDASALGTLPESTVAGKTGATSAAEVVTVGKRLTDDIYVSYQQGLADAEGSFRVAWQFTKSLQAVLRAGYRQGVDGVYRFTLD